MELENQVCNLELSKKLKALGVKQESLFYWDSGGEVKYRPYGDELVRGSWLCSAFTVAEVWELLPKTIDHEWDIRLGEDFIGYWNGDGESWTHLQGDEETEHELYFEEDGTTADRLAEMLIWLIENNYLNLKGTE